jgi:hypothetical protein
MTSRGCFTDHWEADYDCLEHHYVADGGEWTDEETNVLLFEISNALRIQRPHERLLRQLSLTLPEDDSMKSHPRFRKGPYPTYVVESCGRRHRHENSCYPSVRARDFERFYSLVKLLPP